MWEIGLRVLDIKAAPLDASFGYVLEGITREIASIEPELAYRKASGLPVGNLETNLHLLKNHHARVQAIARKKGVDSERAEKQHGTLNLRNVARKNGIEKAYLVNFAFQSGFAHGRSPSYNFLITEDDTRRQFSLGPDETEATEAAVDAITQLALGLSLVADALEDPPLLQRAESLLREANDRCMALVRKE